MWNIFTIVFVLICLNLHSFVLYQYHGEYWFVHNAFGLDRYGPAANYIDNGDGTFTDTNTSYTWEIKTDDDSIHDVDNSYTWSEIKKNNNAEPDGTLVTVFLRTLNNTCDGKGARDCIHHNNCANGEKCGFAGHRDWCIPGAKELQSIVDYGSFRPASSVYGETATTYYWTSTPSVVIAKNAWTVNFFDGLVLNSQKKTDSLHARAMRPCK